MYAAHIVIKALVATKQCPRGPSHLSNEPSHANCVCVTACEISYLCGARQCQSKKNDSKALCASPGSASAALSGRSPRYAYKSASCNSAPVGMVCGGVENGETGDFSGSGVVWRCFGFYGPYTPSRVDRTLPSSYTPSLGMD